jgi:hypothetical protein
MSALYVVRDRRQYRVINDFTTLHFSSHSALVILRGWTLYPVLLFSFPFPLTIVLFKLDGSDQKYLILHNSITTFTFRSPDEANRISFLLLSPHLRLHNAPILSAYAAKPEARSRQPDRSESGR